MNRHIARRLRRSRPIRRAASTILLAIVLTASLRNGISNAAAHQATAPAGSTALPPSETGLANGDTLKISFYEPVGSANPSSSEPMLSALVEHSEMTGRYVVQLDGTIYVPFVGIVKAAGVTRAALQHKLEVKSSSLFNRPVKTVVRLIERQPIYVAGAVPHPGVFDYRAGMTVLHAMILAGLRTAGSHNAERIAVLQETERLQKSDATLANLIARRDVLVALRDGRDPAPSTVLTHLVGRPAAKQWIIAASRLAELEAGKERTAQDGYRDALAVVEKQRKILMQSVQDAESALKHAAARFEFLASTRNRRIITQSELYQARADLDSARIRFNEIQASLAGLEEQAVELRQKRSMNLVEAKMSRQRAIDDLRSAITEAAITRNILAPVVGFTSTDFTSETAPAAVKILRRSPSGMVKLDATMLSPLEPGDIVEVIKPTPVLPVKNSAAARRAGVGGLGIPPFALARPIKKKATP